MITHASQYYTERTELRGEEDMRNYLLEQMYYNKSYVL